jgi:putative transposase
MLAWRLANQLTTDFCIEAVQEALASYGSRDIFNIDQDCQFTAQEFMGLLKDHGIQISMDGIDCRRDNVFVERLCGPSSMRRCVCGTTTASAQPTRNWGGS